MTKKISIKDIAKELNISITTVSFVINGKSKEMGISPATASKVHALIKKRGFNPNSAARSLRTGKSKTIGLIIEDMSNYFFAHIAKIIELEAYKNGYNVFFSSHENSDHTARDLIVKMKNSSVDGLIITPTRGLKTEVLELKKDKMPFVLIDRMIPDIETNYIIIDNYIGAYDLTSHLVKNGYSNIGFISIVTDLSMMDERERGYKEALENNNIKIEEKNILKVLFEDQGEKTIQSIKTFVESNHHLDALFFATNYLGVYGIEALQQAGKLIPHDIAVVSFDDNDLFRLFTPSITIAAQPIKEIAEQAINLLLRLINDDVKSVDETGTVLKPIMVVRNSSPKKVSEKKPKPIQVA